jgi:hypothetical protein
VVEDNDGDEDTRVDANPRACVCVVCGEFIVMAGALALKDGQSDGAHNGITGGTEMEKNAGAARNIRFPSGN